MAESLGILVWKSLSQEKSRNLAQPRHDDAYYIWLHMAFFHFALQLKVKENSCKSQRKFVEKSWKGQENFTDM